MLYAAYETQRVALDGARAVSRAALETLDRLPPSMADLDAVRRLRAAHQVFVDSVITHARLPFGIGKTVVENRPVAVHEEVVVRTPFCTLLRFVKDLPDGVPPQPRELARMVESRNGTRAATAAASTYRDGAAGGGGVTGVRAHAPHDSRARRRSSPARYRCCRRWAPR